MTEPTLEQRWADLFAMIQRAQAGIPGASEQALVAVRFIAEDLQRLTGAPARAAEWQPLTTIPEDCEFIIAAWAVEDDGEGTVDVGEAWRDGGGWLSAVTNTRIEPIVWMPLPLPPGALTGDSNRKK